MTYKIEQGVPVPSAKTSKSEFFDVLADMRVGESFLVTHRGRFSKLKVMASNFKARYKKEFTTRITEEGMRIWRLK